MNSYYFISSGKENKMYTLKRANFSEYSGGYNYAFIKNLSTDYDEAVKKAKEITDRVEGIELELDHEIELNKIVKGKDVLRFGKHKDERIADIPTGYLFWVKNGALVDHTCPFSGEVGKKALVGEEMAELAKLELVKRGELVEFEGLFVKPATKERMLLERSENEKSEYVGEVGKRTEIKNCKITKVVSGESDYGYWAFATLKDEAGNIFMYKTYHNTPLYRPDTYILDGVELDEKAYKKQEKFLLSCDSIRDICLDFKRFGEQRMFRRFRAQKALAKYASEALYNTLEGIEYYKDDKVVDIRTGKLLDLTINYGSKIEDGETFSMSAFVKEYDTYKGTKQTIINRCKIS